MKDTLWGCGSALQDMAYVLNQWLMYGAVFPKARIHVSGKQGVEIGLGPLITISSSVRGECVLSVVTTLGFGAVKVLVPVGNISYQETLQGSTVSDTECAWSFWDLHVSGIASKESGGVSDHDFHKELGLLLSNEGKEDSVWSSGIHWDRHDISMPDK